MLSTPVLFIALCLSFFLSLTYLVYFIYRKDDIKSNDKMGKFKKFILLYMFPTISVFLIISFCVILTLICGLLLFVAVIGGAIYVFGVSCILYDAPYWGILFVSISILGSALMFFMDCTEKEFDFKVQQIKLYNYTDDVSAKEELLVLLKNNEVVSTSSSSTTNTSEYEDNLVLYSFKKYNKLEGYELPFLFESTEYEIIDDTNEILEITTKTIKIYDVYSYFGFYEPSITYKNEYKFFINENSIRLNKY